jgi:hypothetical protein
MSDRCGNESHVGRGERVVINRVAAEYVKSVRVSLQNREKGMNEPIGSWE